MSTCYVQAPDTPQRMQFRIPDGKAPILLSIDSLRRMGAIIDYANDEAIFTKLDPRKLVSLESTQVGHHIIPLGDNPFKNAKDLGREVHRLSALGE